MLDVLYLAVIAGFFALMVGFVRLCDRIVGTGDVAPLADDDGSAGGGTGGVGTDDLGRAPEVEEVGA